MVKITVKFDSIKAAAQIRAAGDYGLAAVGSQALQDTGQYVPEDQGTLKDSGIIHSDKKAENGIYRLRWDTPYAQYLWHGDVMHGNPASRTYGPDKLSFTAALARAEWAKYAQEAYGAEWQKVFQAEIIRRMRE